jgi:hypothetical protein
MGNRIHTIDFFSICEFVGELISSYDSTLFGWWVSSQNQVEVILYLNPTQFSRWGWIKKQTMDFCAVWLMSVSQNQVYWFSFKFCVVLLMGVNQNQEFFVWFSNSWKQLTNHTQLIFSNFYLFCHSNTHTKKNYFQIAEDYIVREDNNSSIFNTEFWNSKFKEDCSSNSRKSGGKRTSIQAYMVQWENNSIQKRWCNNIG